jgi:hypothetical protein
LCQRIAAYATRVRQLIAPPPAPNTLLAVIISLLATGLVMGAVVVFPRDDWIAARAPPLVAYGKVDGLQCRSMSVCTRRLKSSMCQRTLPGAILPEFIFADEEC